MKTSPLFAALLASVLLPLALLQPLDAQAQPAPLLSIADPEGDDVGDGSLAYPRDSAFTAGDLDLRSLRVFADGNNLRFEATMRNNIRHPGTARGPGMGSEDLSVFARRGFYAFNLDIYVDTDRVSGSGNTVSLPGRRATIDPAHAWEKVIVLTPRPELMERMLSDALQEASPASAADIEATTQASVFFATDIRVRGRTVSFVVPGSFLDSQTLARSSITAMVTLAKLSVETEVSLFGKPSSNAIERLSLGVAQPDAGRPLFAMGYVGDRAPATSVVDMVTPDARQQAVQLGRGGVLTGLNSGNQFGLSQVLAVPKHWAAWPAWWAWRLWPPRLRPLPRPAKALQPKACSL
jgi:C-terminal binding-module, SLH-like, of glucodextranase